MDDRRKPCVFRDGLRVVLERLDPALLKPRVRCDFCGRTANELLYGALHQLEGIKAHYYCLLFASNLRQNGEDCEGILGFFPKDIRAELNSSKEQICSYCNIPGATIICVQRRCKKIFHLPCGIANESMHHFFKHFQSFCKAHRPYQRVPQYQLMLPEQPICAICLEEVQRDPKDRSVVWAPCCRVNAWLHRLCVQKLALHSGYFFKCPRCNNKKEFPKAMMYCGIYVPEQDASWETEPNAFEDLYHRHSQCDALVCSCPKGRSYSVDDTEWEVILCDDCGSQGIHQKCFGLPIDSWICDVCIKVEKTPEPVASTSSGTSSPAVPRSPNCLQQTRQSHKRARLEDYGFTISRSVSNLSIKCVQWLTSAEDVKEDEDIDVISLDDENTEQST